MEKLRPFISKYQLVFFYILAYLFSWWIFPILGGAIFPQGPAIAAVVILALVQGRGGLVNLWRQVTRWRVHWTWYLVAPGLIMGIHLGAFIVSQLLGVRVTSTAHLQPWTLMLPVIAQLLLFGGQWEEPGWSGYALPNRQERFSNRLPYGVLQATLIVAFFRAIWHLPLVISGSIPWFDFVFYSLAFQILITWIYNRTRGSVLIVMLLHLTSNIAASTMLPLFSEPDRSLYWVLFVIMACVAALAILVLSRLRLGMPEETASQS